MLELISVNDLSSKVMKYVKQSVVGNTAELVRLCLSRLKKLDLDLTEAELIQISNHVPLFPVEIHLVSDKMLLVIMKRSTITF